MSHVVYFQIRTSTLFVVVATFEVCLSLVCGTTWSIVVKSFDMEGLWTQFLLRLD